MERGVDVSNYQGDIDWRQVRDAGVTWAYVLVTDGTKYVNPKAGDQVGGALAAGVEVGGYHFARHTATAPAAQAAYFAQHCPGGCTLPPMLDSERDWLTDRAANSAWVIGWFDAIGPRVRVWYSNRDGVGVRADSVALQRGGVRLWLAAPAQTDMRGEGAWAVADIVQYGVEAVPGVPGGVDVDRMDTATLAALLDKQEDDDMPYPTVRLDDGVTIVALGPDGPWHVANPATLDLYVFTKVVTPPGDPLNADQSTGLRAAIAERGSSQPGGPVDVAAIARAVAAELGRELSNG